MIPQYILGQMHNWIRENMYLFVLAYYDKLVAFEIPTEIAFHFLFIQYTHKDINQPFSGISVRFCAFDGLTLQYLHSELFAGVFKKETTACKWYHLLNFLRLCKDRRRLQ